MIEIRSEQIFSIRTKEEFEDVALRLFRFQADSCAVYRAFIENLRIDPNRVKRLDEIPFLPVEFFKNHSIIKENASPEITFTSSGTTGMQQSRHQVSDVSLYETSFRKGFEFFYGNIEKYALLALLPSYLEREGSSLIYMTDDLIKSAGTPSGYFLHNYEELYNTLRELQNQQKPVILIGVTYALLDFIEKYQLSFPDLIVMETGGMKGKRKEMIREELHQALCEGFGVSSIHSEYGMTELLSQAYSKVSGVFRCPPWMNVLIRDTNDPLTVLPENRTGGINVIDLANLNSCSFIATQDLGKKFTNGSFEVLGRFDNSDIRGCNLLVQ